MSKSVADKMEEKCAAKKSKHCKDCFGTIEITPDDWKEVEDPNRSPERQALDLFALAQSGGSDGCDCHVVATGKLDTSTKRGTITCRGIDPTQKAAGTKLII